MGRVETRRWNKGFDSNKYLVAIGASPSASGLWTLPGGRFVSAYPGRPGKVAIFLSGTATGPLIIRTFAHTQLAEMKEWATSGGKLKKEQARKALMDAAPDLLAAAERLVSTRHPHHEGCPAHGSIPGSLSNKCVCALEDIRAAIAKAKGDK